MPNAAGAISQRLNPSLATIRSFDKNLNMDFPGYFSLVLIISCYYCSMAQTGRI
jgi:hypothetical protein